MRKTTAKEKESMLLRKIRRQFLLIPNKRRTEPEMSTEFMRFYPYSPFMLPKNQGPSSQSILRLKVAPNLPI